MQCAWQDVADVVDSVQDVRNAGLHNGRPAVMLIVNRQPGANIIETVDRIHALMPALRASAPAAVDLDVVMDRTITIRASLREVERTLLISVGAGGAWWCSCSCATRAPR